MVKEQPFNRSCVMVVHTQPVIRFSHIPYSVKCLVLTTRLVIINHSATGRLFFFFSSFVDRKNDAETDSLLSPGFSVICLELHCELHYFFMFDRANALTQSSLSHSPQPHYLPAVPTQIILPF